MEAIRRRVTLGYPDENPEVALLHKEMLRLEELERTFMVSQAKMKKALALTLERAAYGPLEKRLHRVALRDSLESAIPILNDVIAGAPLESLVDLKAQFLAVLISTREGFLPLKSLK